ncbi:MAG: cytochrome D1 domain-containing protein [Gemmatimonadota bacterium]|nr:cytochrome D1 domain-containing protein [Gemmatimonadota bacterium]
MRSWRWIIVLAGLTAPVALAGQGYRVGVVSESGDIVTWLRPGAGTLTQDRVVPVGIMPADIDGPHNLAVSPDNRYYYMSIAHGTPYGTLWKMDAGNDTLAGRAPLEMFPTTIGLTPDGELAFVANSDFHGDHPRVNVVSVVHTPTMSTITHLPACDMPHGVKSNHAGTRVYISCMNSDELLEIEVATLRITRRGSTGAGHDMNAMSTMDHGAGSHAPPPASAPAPAKADDSCAPTFVTVSPDDRTLYAACNHGNSVQVWDAASFTKVKEIPVGTGAYNIEPSPDGQWLIVTNKKAQSFSLLDARSLAEVVRVPTTKKIVHGVAWSPDGRYAFISQESIGADPGAVDMFDLTTRKTVATVPVPAQPTGIAILRIP